MKVCLINSLFSPYSRGGAEVVVERIAAGLGRAGHQVVVITLGREQGTQKEKNVTMYRIKPWNVFSFLDIGTSPFWLRLIWHVVDALNVSGSRQVRAILLAERPDVVCTHNLKGISYLVPRLVRRLGLRHIHTVHDVQLTRPSGIILVGQEKPFVLLDKLYEKICRWLFGSPDVVLAPSQWLLDYYRRRGFFYESQKVVLPNPVVLQHVTRGQQEKHPGVTFLFVGQLEASKGILLLLDAVEKLHGEWWLRIAGGGRLQQKVERRIERNDRIAYLGRLPHQHMPHVYQQADITVVPSLCYENSPSVVSESLVANVPVIASDIGGIPELVKDDVNGFTFAPGNEASLVEVLQHFVDHPELIAGLKKNCFVSVRQFSLDAYLKQLVTLCQGSRQPEV